jgi:hypothetical protein
MQICHRVGGVQVRYRRIDSGNCTAAGRTGSGGGWGGGGGILLNYYIRVRRNAAGIWEWGEGEEGRTEEGGEGLQ